MKGHIEIKQKAYKMQFKKKLMKFGLILIYGLSFLCVMYVIFETKNIILVFGLAGTFLALTIQIRNLYFDYYVISQKEMLDIINNFANISMDIINNFTRKTVEDLQVNNIKEESSKTIN